MAKKNSKRKTVRLVSASGATYYTERRNDGEKLKGINKYDNNTKKVESFDEFNGSLGRNVVKKRK
jgi:ribosomal protein L33